MNTEQGAADRPVIGVRGDRIDRLFLSCKRLRSAEIQDALRSAVESCVEGSEPILTSSIQEHLRPEIKGALVEHKGTAVVLDCAIVSWVMAQVLVDTDLEACEEHINNVCLLAHQTSWRKLRTALVRCRFSSPRRMARHYTSQLVARWVGRASI